MSKADEIWKDRKSYKECIERLKAIGDNNLSLFANNIYDENIEAIRFLFNKYVLKVEQLETEKEKLIKDLEWAIDFTKTGRDLISKAKVECLENVLKILKGENGE